jgi:hypothetical protein
MSDSSEFYEVNVRSPYYFIARTHGVCGHCQKQTELIAVALPSGHETLDAGEETEEALETDEWTVATNRALLFHIEYLNEAVAARLSTLTQSFRIDRKYLGAEPAWSNHCSACGALLDDEELFCEPGEPFFPVTETGVAAIRLQRIDDPFVAVAGGYFFDPDFLPAMSLG